MSAIGVIVQSAATVFNKIGDIILLRKQEDLMNTQFQQNTFGQYTNIFEGAAVKDEKDNTPFNIALIGLVVLGAALVYGIIRNNKKEK